MVTGYRAGYQKRCVKGLALFCATTHRTRFSKAEVMLCTFDFIRKIMYAVIYDLFMYEISSSYFYKYLWITADLTGIPYCNTGYFQFFFWDNHVKSLRNPRSCDLQNAISLKSCSWVVLKKMLPLNIVLPSFVISRIRFICSDITFPK